MYPEPSGVNIRIAVFELSQTYKLPDISSVIPLRPLNLELNPGPSTKPLSPSPAIVDTTIEVIGFVKYAERIEALSVIYNFPELLIIMLCNSSEKIALEPMPSTVDLSTVGCD